MNTELFPGSEKYPLLELPSRFFRLKDTIGDHPVWMWQDDPEDFAFGGNKVRFYEYLIPEIISAKPDFILTSGSCRSNHVRVSAEVASRLGIGCTLLISCDAPAGEETPNIRMARELGAEIVYIGGFAAMMKISEYAKNLRDAGGNFYHVPNAGHTPGAVRAYAGVLADIIMEMDNYSLFPSDIFLPCASGTTLSGVLCGCAVLKSWGVNIPSVTGIAVANTPKGAQKGVRALLSEADVQLHFGCESASASVLDCQKNSYGCPDSELLELRDRITAAEGVTLDRTYNINAFYGMTKQLEANPGRTPVVYINTGGYTG